MRYRSPAVGNEVSRSDWTSAAEAISPLRRWRSTSSRADRWFIRMVITSGNSSPVIARANDPWVAITLVGEKNPAVKPAKGTAR